MPAYNSTEYNAGGALSQEKISARSKPGLNVHPFTFAATTALAAADTVNLLKLPANSTVLDVVISGDGNLGTTFTLDVGDADNADRFIDGLDCTNATGFLGRLGNVVGSMATGPNHTYTSETDIVATVATAAAGTTDVTVKGYVLFVVGE